MGSHATQSLVLLRGGAKRIYKIIQYKGFTAILKSEKQPLFSFWTPSFATEMAINAADMNLTFLKNIRRKPLDKVISRGLSKFCDNYGSHIIIFILLSMVTQ